MSNYDDAAFEGEAKAEELLAKLTQDEKLEMMNGDMPFWPGILDLMKNGVGAIRGTPALFRGSASPVSALSTVHAVSF